MVSLCGPEFDSPQVHQMRGLQVVNSDLQPSLVYVVDLVFCDKRSVAMSPLGFNDSMRGITGRNSLQINIGQGAAP